MHTIPLQFYDNNWKTADRYTVLYEYDAILHRYNCISMSDDPEHPQGISQCDWCHEYCATDGTIGNRIDVEGVPHNVLVHALKRLSLIA